MTIDQIRAVHLAHPFRPFVLHLADGRAMQVRHPEFLAYSHTGRTVIVATPGDVFERVDALLIVSVEELKDSSAA
jgi:hypothetical protein